MGSITAMRVQAYSVSEIMASGRRRVLARDCSVRKVVPNGEKPERIHKRDRKPNDVLWVYVRRSLNVSRIIYRILVSRRPRIHYNMISSTSPAIIRIIITGSRLIVNYSNQNGKLNVRFTRITYKAPHGESQI